jgi:hypothetical protein
MIRPNALKTYHFVPCTKYPPENSKWTKNERADHLVKDQENSREREVPNILNLRYSFPVNRHVRQQRFSKCLMA